MAAEGARVSAGRTGRIVKKSAETLRPGFMAGTENSFPRWANFREGWARGVSTFAGRRWPGIVMGWKVFRGGLDGALRAGMASPDISSAL